MIASMSQGMPIWCTQRIVGVFGVTAAAISAASRAVADRLDVDEDRRRSALADGVGAGNEGVIDGDDLVARAHADAEQREMQRRCAVGHGTGMGCACDGGEGFLEARDARALR